MTRYIWPVIGIMLAVAVQGNLPRWACPFGARPDLILVVLLKEDFGLLEFFTQEVSKIEKVQSVESFIVYKGYNLKVPYIL